MLPRTTSLAPLYTRSLHISGVHCPVHQLTSQPLATLVEIAPPHHQTTQYFFACHASSIKNTDAPVHPVPAALVTVQTPPFALLVALRVWTSKSRYQSLVDFMILFRLWSRGFRRRGRY